MSGRKHMLNLNDPKVEAMSDSKPSIHVDQSCAVAETKELISAFVLVRHSDLVVVERDEFVFSQDHRLIFHPECGSGHDPLTELSSGASWIWMHRDTSAVS